MWLFVYYRLPRGAETFRLFNLGCVEAISLDFDGQEWSLRIFGAAAEPYEFRVANIQEIFTVSGDVPGAIVRACNLLAEGVDDLNAIRNALEVDDEGDWHPAGLGEEREGIPLG